MKNRENDIKEAVLITSRVCLLLLHYAKQSSALGDRVRDRKIPREKQLRALREAVSHIVRCAPLFVGTNLDRKIEYFNTLSTRFRNVWTCMGARWVVDHFWSHADCAKRDGSEAQGKRGEAMQALYSDL